MLTFILLYIVHMSLFTVIGFMYGRRKGYSEGVNMCRKMIERTVEEELQKQLIGKMEVFSHNIKEVAYELRKIDQ